MEPIRYTRHLREEGYADIELARLRRQGAIRAVRRGAYVLDGASEPCIEEQHRELVAAAVGELRTPAVVSHMSAALLHGLPLWNDQLDKVHLLRGRPNGGHIDTLVHLHVAPLSSSEVTEIDGIRVTNLARTVCDLARTLSAFRAVPIGDAALAQGLERRALIFQLARCKGWRGIVRARRTIEFLDPRSESVAESSSRVVIHEQGLPTPELQVEVFDDRGYLIGRSDFGWIERRTLGEFDGQGKYGELLAPGRATKDAVLDEKRREDRLRSYGWQVARWDWPVLNTPAELRKRILRAFALADGSAPAIRAVPGKPGTHRRPAR